MGDEAYLRVGDLNDDGAINAQDFTVAAEIIKGENGLGLSIEEFDLNEDGEITLADYLYMIKNWGEDE